MREPRRKGKGCALRSLSAIAAFLVLPISYLPVHAQIPESGTTTETSTIEAVFPPGSSRNELEMLIKAKSDELQKINRELETTNSNLKSTREQKANLEHELSRLQSNIDQLELNIRADSIATEKLGLELDSLQYDIRDIELGVTNKTEAIAHVIRELQKSGSVTPLIILLRNNTLADGFWEEQSLKNLRTQLALDIANLKSLYDRMHEKLKLVGTKKTDVEAHQKNLTVRRAIVQDQKQERKTILTQTKSKETLYEQQLAELKKQQDAISDEIAKVEDQLRASFDPSLLPIPRGGFLAWPVTLVGSGGKGRITQHFGEVSKLYRGRPHNGLDIGAPIGTPVFAADDGIVTAVDNNDRSAWSKYQYGKYILVRHATNLTSLYAHLSKYAVKEGDTVKRGDVIGYVGSTGYATGAHLHFGLYWAPSVLLKSVPPATGLVPVGVAVDAEKYL